MAGAESRTSTSTASAAPYRSSAPLAADRAPAGSGRRLNAMGPPPYAYAGYSLVLLGEGMCSAALNLGPEVEPPALFAEAKARFDKAVTAATAAGDATGAAGS